MAERTLLIYKNSLDTSDIPGAQNGTKNIQLTKSIGRDYINVHDIHGAIPKANVGYTGRRRFDGEGSNGSSLDRSQGHNELIGRPKLKKQEVQPQMQQPAFYSTNNYQMPIGQQLDSNQVYRTLAGNDYNQQQYSSPVKSGYEEQLQSQDLQRHRVNFIDQERVVQMPELKLGSPGFNQSNSPGQQIDYEDTLDKFLTERGTGNQRYGSGKILKNHPQKQQSDTQSIGGNGNNGFEEKDTAPTLAGSQSMGMLSVRNYGLAKSTANLILNKPQEDQFTQNLLLNKNKNILLQISKNEISPNHKKTSTIVGDSPAYQVQKNIKQSQSAFKADGTDDNYLEKIFQGQQKKRNLFTINASTLPESGRYDVRESKAQVTRGLSLLPNTNMGTNNHQEIDHSILNREYTKLGGANLAVQMPIDLNNIQYHRKNPMKDFTYNSMTGSYNFAKN